MDRESLRRQVESQIGPLRLEQLELGHLGHGSCSLEVEVRDDQKNYMGIVHGGIIFAIMDSCAGITAATLDKKAVTLNSSINFIRSISQGRIKAVSDTLHDGRSTSVIRVRAYDQDAKLLADANFTMYNLKK